MLSARVKLFVTSKSGGYGFLDVGKGLFFHATNGRKYNHAADTFTDEEEVVSPREGDALYYEVGPGIKPDQIQAVRWAFVP